MIKFNVIFSTPKDDAMKNLAGGRRNLHTTPNRFARIQSPWSYESAFADAICFKGKENVCHSNFTFV